MGGERATCTDGCPQVIEMGIIHMREMGETTSVKWRTNYWVPAAPAVSYPV